MEHIMLHTLKNTYLTVCVSELGAELMSIKGADGTEFLWQGDAAYWKDRAPVLFPYVGRLFQKSATLMGESCQLELHGFARRCRFLPEEVSDTAITLLLESSPETLAQYPREFALRVIYRLEENRVQICFRVDSKDKKPMFFGLGGHPGFRVPMDAGLAFEDYSLRFENTQQPQRVIFTPQGLFSGKLTPYALENHRLPLRHDLFDDDAIVLKNAGSTVTLAADNGKHSVTVDFPQMQYIGFWQTEKSDAAFLCIEPWCSLPGMADQLVALEAQPDLIRLEPGCRYENHWQITLNGICP